MIKKFLLSLIVVLIVISCDSNEEKDPIKIQEKSNNAAKTLKSAIYNINYLFKQGEQEFKSKIKVYVQRTDRKEYPFNVRYEYDDGVIAVYDGNEYRWLEENKVNFIPKGENQKEYIEGYRIAQTLYMIMQDADAPNNNFKNRDSMKLLDVKNDKYFVLNSNKHIQEYNADINSFEFYDKKTYRLLKDSTFQSANGQNAIIVFNIEDLQENPTIDKSIFTLEPKDGQELVKFEQTEKQQIQESSTEGQAAPNFELLDGSGKKVSLQSLKGKVVVLDFWGTWCKWCVKSMPQLEALRKEYQSNPNVVIYGISCSEPPNADPIKFLKDHNINYPTLLQGDEVAQSFGVTGFPTLYVLDKNGKIIKIHSGFTETMQQDLSAEIKKLL